MAVMLAMVIECDGGGELDCFDERDTSYDKGGDKAGRNI
jgi:hypothetical protein